MTNEERQRRHELINMELAKLNDREMELERQYLLIAKRRSELNQQAAGLVQMQPRKIINYKGEV